MTQNRNSGAEDTKPRMQVVIRDISSGKTLRDVIGKVLGDALDSEWVDKFTSDLADEWGMFLLMDEDEADWENYAAGVEQFTEWVEEQMKGSGLSEDELEFVIGYLLNEVADFFQVKFKEAWNMIVWGVA